MWDKKGEALKLKSKSRKAKQKRCCEKKIRCKEIELEVQHNNCFYSLFQECEMKVVLVPERSTKWQQKAH